MQHNENDLKIEAVARCVQAHPTLACAWEVISRNEQCDMHQKEKGILLAIERGWATRAEYDALVT